MIPRPIPIINLFIVLILFSYLAYAQNQILLRIATQETTKLYVGQTLSSPLGIYRMTLQRASCSLRVQKINISQQSPKYSVKNIFVSPDFTHQCEYIQISSDGLRTNQGFNYIIIRRGYSKASFSIDDNGIFRIVATNQNQKGIITDYICNDDDRYKSENTTFQRNFIKPVCQYQVDKSLQFAPIINQNNWTFTAKNGNFIISKQLINDHIEKSYYYGSINISPKGIYDQSNQTFPYSSFLNIRFRNFCGKIKKYLNLQNPFTLQVSKYWPIVRIYDQNKLMITYFSINDKQYFCPQRTFEFKGICVIQCPEPFYHEINGLFGRCVLICAQDQMIDAMNRVCYCGGYKQYSTQLMKKCDPVKNQTSYLYGCYCHNNKFYDQQLAFKCVSDCPIRTIGINGICIKCQQNCQRCQKDNTYQLSFLHCVKCDDQYTLMRGICVKNCKITSNCSVCPQNCDQCEKDGCIRCKALYTLQNGVCKINCSSQYKIVLYDNFSAKCIKPQQSCKSFSITQISNNLSPQPICTLCQSSLFPFANLCVNKCPFERNLSNNKCSCRQGVSIFNKCTKLCPVRTYYDLKLNECIACPNGCLTCDNHFCTSCYPDQFLFVSPVEVTCKKKNIYNICEGKYQYNFANLQDVCIYKEYFLVQMANCAEKIQSCMICKPKSSTQCILCLSQYYLFNNTCVQKCPEKTIPYKLTCLPIVQNCLSSNFIQQSTIATIDNNILQQSQALKLYLNDGKQPTNNVEIYQAYARLVQKNIKDNNNFNAKLNYYKFGCVKCQQGYGVNSFKQCQKCPQQCDGCYYANKLSCINTKIVKTEKNSTNNDVSKRVCQGFLNVTTKQCVSSCQIGTYPYIQQGQALCKQLRLIQKQTETLLIDGSIFTLSQKTNIVYFVFNKQIQPFSVPQFKTPNFSIMLPHMANSEIKSLNFDKGLNQYFFELVKNDSNLTILNISQQLPNIKTPTNSSLPNTIYGFTKQTAYNSILTGWLAYVGYVFSLIFIVMHIVYIGNQLMYKLDNIIIFFQSVFYVLFIEILFDTTLGQYLYGWTYLHCSWFINILLYAIPTDYYEKSAPNPYKMITLDANLLRNAGYSICILVIFYILLGIIALVVWKIKTIKNKIDIWYPRLVKNSGLSIFQFLSINIIYWSFAQILYGERGQQINILFWNICYYASILILAVAFIYSIIRTYFNPIGGLYMFKRFAIAVVFVFSYKRHYLLGALIFLESLFIFFRFLLQKPRHLYERIFIFVESSLFIIAYALLFNIQNTWVISVFISIIAFVALLGFSFDLIELYFEGKNQWLQWHFFDPKSNDELSSQYSNISKPASKLIVKTSKNLQPIKEQQKQNEIAETQRYLQK